jgi:hypothetical protein
MTKKTKKKAEFRIVLKENSFDWRTKSLAKVDTSIPLETVFYLENVKILKFYQKRVLNTDFKPLASVFEFYVN